MPVCGDGVKHHSCMRSQPREFWFPVFWITPLWNLFELPSFHHQNRLYSNTPTNQTLAQLFNCIAYLAVIKALL